METLAEEVMLISIAFGCRAQPINNCVKVLSRPLNLVEHTRRVRVPVTKSYL